MNNQSIGVPNYGAGTPDEDLTPEKRYENKGYATAPPTGFGAARPASFAPSVAERSPVPLPPKPDVGNDAGAPSATGQESAGGESEQPERMAAPAAVTTSFLPDLSPYDLTVAEAVELFAQHNRRRPSERTMQRYCQDGRFDCYKLKTTRASKPIFEWIINSTSLVGFIQSKPKDALGDKPLPAGEVGDASDGTNNAQSPEDTSVVMATPIENGDANNNTENRKYEKTVSDVVTTPERELATPMEGDGGQGSLSKVQLLIQNAELTAQLEAKGELVEELRSDKRFLREQIEHERKNDALLGDMHRETLQTLKAVAVAGRHTKIEMPLPAEGQGADQTADYDV